MKTIDNQADQQISKLFLHLPLNDRWEREGTWRPRCSRARSTSQGTPSSGPLTCPLTCPSSPIQNQHFHTLISKVKVKYRQISNKECPGSTCTLVAWFFGRWPAGATLLRLQLHNRTGLLKWRKNKSFWLFVVVCSSDDTRHKSPTNKSPGFHLKPRLPHTPAWKRSVSWLSLKR